MPKRYRRHKNRISPTKKPATPGRNAVLICAAAIVWIVGTGYPLWLQYVNHRHVHIPVVLVSIDLSFFIAAVVSVTLWWKS